MNASDIFLTQNFLRPLKKLNNGTCMPDNVSIVLNVSRHDTVKAARSNINRSTTKNRPQRNPHWQ